MLGKQHSKRYDKFYHNDIKKQLGVDESRTASEKLLDRVIKVDKRPDFYQTDNHIDLNSQPKKKVKLNTEGETQKPTSNLQILQGKLIKNIENQQNITKLLKSLSILKKCLNQQSFLNDGQINFKQNWNIYTEKLINEVTERNYCSGESYNIMTIIGDCVEVLVEKFADCKKESSEKDVLLNQGEKLLIPSKQEVYVNFCRLFTDDSFIFHKNLKKLKTFIFSQFDGTHQASQQSKAIAVTLINKVVLIPTKADWMYSSLVNLFKQFNNLGYPNRLGDETARKAYLRNFNQLLNRKAKNIGSKAGETSYNMMGDSKQSVGVKTVYVQTSNQTGNDKWISKQ